MPSPSCQTHRKRVRCTNRSAPEDISHTRTSSRLNTSPDHGCLCTWCDSDVSVTPIASNIINRVHGSPQSASNRLHGHRTRAFTWRPVPRPSLKTDQFRLTKTQSCAPGRRCHQVSPVSSPRSLKVLRHPPTRDQPPHAYQPPPTPLPPPNQP